MGFCGKLFEAFNLNEMIVRNGNRQSETRSAIALSNLLNELVDELLPMEVFNEIIS